MDIYVYCLTTQTNTLKDKQKKEKKTILFLVIFCLHFMGLVLLLLLLLLTLTFMSLSMLLLFVFVLWFYLMALIHSFIAVHFIPKLKKTKTKYFLLVLLSISQVIRNKYDTKANCTDGKWLRWIRKEITNRIQIQ